MCIHTYIEKEREKLKAISLVSFYIFIYTRKSKITQMAFISSSHYFSNEQP